MKKMPIKIDIVATAMMPPRTVAQALDRRLSTGGVPGRVMGKKLV
jgi:hypothetical protein